MESLDWVDRTYTLKHKKDNPSNLRAMYYPNLQVLSTREVKEKKKNNPVQAITLLLLKYGRKAGISLAIFGLSYVPYIGRLVLPAASFYTFNKAVGLGPAAVIFGTGIFLPRSYLIIFLQTYFSSRSLMRELVRFPT